MEYPGVDSVCVTPADDEELGQRICAFFKLQSTAGRDAFSIDQVRKFLIDRKVATFKLPDQIEVISEWPLTKVKKVDREKLRQMAQEHGKQAC